MRFLKLFLIYSLLHFGLFLLTSGSVYSTKAPFGSTDVPAIPVHDQVLGGMNLVLAWPVYFLWDAFRLETSSGALRLALLLALPLNSLIWGGALALAHISISRCRSRADRPEEPSA